MVGRQAAWIAWTVCAVTLLAGAGAVVLGVLDGVSPFSKSHLLFVATCAVAGALVIGSRPANALGWALAAGALSFALLEFCGEYAIAGTGPAARLAGWPETWLWVPANLGLALIPLLFPDGRRPARHWWWLLGPLAATALAAAVLGALRPGPSDQVRPGTDVVNPFGVAGLLPAADAVGAAFTVLAGVAFIAGGGAVLWRARRADDVRRHQLKWVAWAAGIAAVVVVGRLIAGLTDADPGSPWPRADLFWETAGAVALSLLPAALTVAVLRHRLYDIDVLITRTLLYGTLSACLLGGYALIAGYLGALLGRSTSLSVSAPAAAAVAVAFAPLRDRIQRGITVLMHGRREEPYAVLARLGRRLDEAVAPAAVLPVIAETVAETLRASWVVVTVAGAPATAIGTAPPGAMPAELPLTWQGAAVGTLSIWPRPAFTEAVLADLARQVGAAVHSARLADDLQRSRERLVMAREEERRRLRRDLHDGLGPTLAALTMRAEAAQDAGPDAAPRLLAKVVDDAEAAVRDVRRLVDGLRPAALDSLGLVGALAAHLAGLPAGAPVVRLIAPDALPALPAATEVAAYRIAVEAVTNICRHAGAAYATVELSVDGDRLVVLVGDDGRGADGVPPGVGLTSMRERADELGGSLTVETGPAGTRVRAALPATAPEGN